MHRALRSHGLLLAPPCLLLLLLGCMGTASGSPYDPHAPDMTVLSWFEGWYLRVLTDAERSDNGAPAALGVITGYVPRGHATWNSSLVELILQRAGGRGAPDVRARTGLQLNLTAGGGQPIQGDPSLTAPPNFTIAAADGSLLWSFEGERCSVAVRVGNASLYMECEGPPAAWGPGGLGPEGLAAALPTRLTGLHWFVHSLGTPVSFTLVEDGKAPITGKGLAHMEKNYGHSFPDGWIWAQGLEQGRGSELAAEPAAQVAFAVAGGQIPSPWAPARWLPDAWLLGVRTANFSWDLHFYDTIFVAQSSPCAAPLLKNSTFNLTAVQPLLRREVRLEVSADPGSFSTIECPTNEGFKPYSVESYSATATLRLFQWDLNPRGEKEWLQKRLLEALTLHNVALEFGGDRRCKEPSSSPSLSLSEGPTGRPESDGHPEVSDA